MRKSHARLKQLSSHLNDRAYDRREQSLPADIEGLLSKGKCEEAARKMLSAFLQPTRYKPRPEQLTALERAEKTRFISDGIELMQYVWNPTSNDTIILIHGFGTSTAFLTQVIEHLLSTTTSRILAIDQAAHGASSGIKTSFGQFIATLKDVVEKELVAGRNVRSLIGHSVGATAIFMLYYQYSDIFQKQMYMPNIVALNPPLQPTTLMQGFCLQQKVPLSLVDGMRAAFRPSPEDVLNQNLGESNCFKDVKVMIAQDDNDKVAMPKETKELVEQLGRGGAKVLFKTTSGMGHFKIVGNLEVLDLVVQNCM